MINARVSLFGFMRSFFEQKLCDLVAWKDVKADAPIPAEKTIHGRRNPTGKFKEIATIRFGDYTLTAESTDVAPPLGRLVLDCPDGREEGPLEQGTLENLGNFIRSRGMRTFDHGRQRTDSIVSGEWGRPG